MSAEFPRRTIVIAGQKQYKTSASRRAASRRWYWKNRERDLVRRRKWHADNRERAKASKRRWDDTHRFHNAIYERMRRRRLAEAKAKASAPRSAP